MNDLDWFIDQVEGLAEQLNLNIYEEHEGNVFVNDVREETAEEQEHEDETNEEQIKNRSRGRWDTEEKVTLATGNQSPKQNNENNTSHDEPSMAFEIKMSPTKKPNSQSSPVSLRQKTKPNVPRPHTVHLERSTVSPEKEDEERTRTFSDSQEQDENKPPAEAVAFVITAPENGVMARKRDRMLKRQLEREEELRRKKLDFEELKRNQEKEKLMNEEYLNNLKKMDQERREAILKNHKQSKSPAPIRKPAKSLKKPNITIPNDPFSPSRVSRSQSTTLHRDNKSEKDWDTMSCVSTLTTTRLFRDPKSKSNKSLMLMALKYQCLPGPVNANERKKAEEALNNSCANHFMALYKSNKYKGLYEVEQMEEILKIMKIHGTGPKEVNEMMIADLLKYNSGMKAFQSVGSKTLSPSIDGFCLKNQCWLTKRPKTAAATASVRS